MQLHAIGTVEQKVYLAVYTEKNVILLQIICTNKL
jgi:hypothetical protein